MLREKGVPGFQPVLAELSRRKEFRVGKDDIADFRQHEDRPNDRAERPEVLGRLEPPQEVVHDKPPVSSFAPRHPFAPWRPKSMRVAGPG